MCGINGIIYKNGEVNTKEILQMNEAIEHRGPDDSGIFEYENIVLGHQRLSILDLSQKGQQPMSNDGRFWIIYNGEIYNFLEIKEQLIKLGHIFYSKTDTEVILNSFKEWGPSSFEKFNGMWSFCILDTMERKLTISRDRYGVKPCYYYNDSNKFIFSSEIKGIFCSNSNIELDENKLIYAQKKLEKYFTTIYKNVDIVPPGSFLTINLKNFKMDLKRWWYGLENLPKISNNNSEIKENINDLLVSSTKIRLISDTKIGTSLSGGIDSSIIFYILNELEKSNHKEKNLDLNPFIVNYKSNRTFDNAMNLSKYFKKNPIVINYDEELISDFSYNLSSIELIEPFFSQLEIYKAQKNNGFKVTIDGHGADECFGGYHQDIEQFGIYFQNSLVDLYKTIINLKGLDFLNKTIDKMNFIKNIHGFNIDLKKGFLNQVTKNEYIDYKTINLKTFSLEEDLKELKNYNFPLQLMYLNANFGPLQWLLNKWDKASMASSVEIRSPFLDWRVFQYGLAIPADIKIKNGQNKSILRDTYKNKMPKEILDNKFKQGLPSVDFKINEKNINFIKESLIQKDFTENKIWNAKKIISDFENSNSRSIKIKKIWRIVRTYLLNKGFENRKKNLVLKKTKKLNFNLLTQTQGFGS